MKLNQENQTTLPLDTLTAEESLQRMQQAVNHFYRLAVLANCHPFLEVAGFMEELLKIYRHNLTLGIDFRDCHRHSGRTLQMEDWHLNYINEKIRCIFNDALELHPVKQHSPDSIPK